MPYAEVGELASQKAINALRRFPVSDVQVHETTPSSSGAYACIDCGLTPQNNFQAIDHMRGSHRIAWLNTDTLTLEVV